jgi:hypothetical protein
MKPRTRMPNHPEAWRDEPPSGLRDALRIARVVEKRPPTEDDRRRYVGQVSGLPRMRERCIPRCIPRAVLRPLDSNR